ncbi:potassium channel family protein [Sinanaerobacter sp. ZZT-01]|uniref:potassium channel family protein n=1 Tax=Sinanaerobacter sp. ZZT-01 TaxID=3111540 RepID=UPI002D78111A|nr:NAD-binding protein [Sinanaerobacter sp. ZZT-01]WRR92452.1 NAD-binding protein [Sinanaerobacter sp. ZZT-01]
MFGTKNKSILIAGCGRLGGSIAGSLSEQGYKVTVIDPDKEAFRKLPPAFSGFQIIGDATDLDTLVKAGIKDTDILMATADRDNVNLMIAQIGNVIYEVKQVYIRLYDMEKQQLVEGLHIYPIFPAKLSIQEFERLSTIDIKEELL